MSDAAILVEIVRSLSMCPDCPCTAVLHASLPIRKCSGPVCSANMLGRLANSAGVLGKLVAQQFATAGAVQQAAAAAAGTGLLQILGQQSFATNSHDIFNVHRPGPDNNWNTEFDFTPANYKRVS